MIRTHARNVVLPLIVIDLLLMWSAFASGVWWPWVVIVLLHSFLGAAHATGVLQTYEGDEHRDVKTGG